MAMYLREVSGKNFCHKRDDQKVWCKKMRVLGRLRMRSIRVLLFGLMKRCVDVVDVCGWKNRWMQFCVVRKKKEIVSGENRGEWEREREGRAEGKIEGGWPKVLGKYFGSSGLLLIGHFTLLVTSDVDIEGRSRLSRFCRW